MGTVRCPPEISRMRWRAAKSGSTSYSTNSLRFHSSQSRISPVWGQRAVPKSSSLATSQHLQRFAHDMVDRSLHLLNAGDVVAVDDDGKIRQPLALNLAAIVPEEGDGEHISFAGFFERGDDVARTAAGGDADGNILRTSLCD